MPKATFRHGLSPQVRDETRTIVIKFVATILAITDGYKPDKPHNVLHWVILNSLDDLLFSRDKLW